MIIELQTIRLQIGEVQIVEDIYASTLPERVTVSKLGGFWHATLGTMNQIVLAWEYDDLAHLQRVSDRVAKLKSWPPPITKYVLEEEAVILQPAPFSPPLAPRRLGEVYEIRSYTYMPGAIPQVIKRWTETIERRVALSPMAFGGHTVYGPLNRWITVWPYSDVAERQRIRTEAIRAGIWPPNTHDIVTLLKQEAALYAPAAFSPLC